MDNNDKAVTAVAILMAAIALFAFVAMVVSAAKLVPDVAEMFKSTSEVLGGMSYYEDMARSEAIVVDPASQAGPRQDEAALETVELVEENQLPGHVEHAEQYPCA